MTILIKELNDHKDMRNFKPDRTGVEFPEHTADVWIKARSGDLGDLFVKMANGLYLLVSEEYSIEEPDGTEEETFMGSLDQIMVEFLSELLYLLDGEYSLIIQPDVRVTHEDDEYRLELRGKKYRCRIKEEGEGIEVKAITHHGVNIERDENGQYVSEVLVDI